MNSLQTRFIVIMIGATILFAIPLFIAFSVVSAHSLEMNTTVKQQQVIEANANALAKPLWDFDSESVARISTAISQSSEIRRVAVANMSGTVLTSSPSDIRPQEDQGVRFDANITYRSSDGDKDVGRLTLWFQRASGMPFYKRDGAWTGFLFVASILTLVLSAIIGNHHMTVRPLRQLASTIQRTKQLGSRHRVGLRSKTEIGELARTFDEMQERLAREEADLKLAHEQAINLYNSTPAMLFSLDMSGSVSAVSDYWLSATGYDRSRVIGRPFADFVVLENDGASRTARTGSANFYHDDVIVLFRCANGKLIFVMVREAGAVDIGAEASASLCVMTDVTALKEAERKVHLQAVTDRLTNLLNRHGFEAELVSRITKADLSEEKVGCIYLDLNGFKLINDTFGHGIGDQVLTEVASRLKDATEDIDAVARLGGDEFAILVSGQQVAERLEKIKNDVEHTIQQPILIASNRLSIGASIGSSIYPEEAHTSSDLIRMSDAAMYRVKHFVANQIGRRSDVRVNSDQQLLIDCLTNGWFEPFFQPIVNLNSGKPVGFEALMRVRHPRDGLLMPSRIIQAAEKTGVIGRVDAMVMRRSIAGLARLHADKRYDDVYLTINASSLSMNSSLIANIIESAAHYGVDLNHLVLEITETHSLLDVSEGGKAIEAFRARGGRVAVDDFGTGYSSYNFLSEEAVDIVKIDRSFISGLTCDDPGKRERAQKVLSSISLLARTLKYDIIAEGIESRTQNHFVTLAGISAGQGFLFSKPKSLEHWLSPAAHRVQPLGVLGYA